MCGVCVRRGCVWGVSEGGCVWGVCEEGMCVGCV